MEGRGEEKEGEKEMATVLGGLPQVKEGNIVGDTNKETIGDNIWIITIILREGNIERGESIEEGGGKGVGKGSLGGGGRGQGLNGILLEEIGGGIGRGIVTGVEG